MSVKTRILLISVLTSFAFWIPIWLPFAETKGLNTEQALQIISIYLILVVLFEYPTGVIGDSISHKFSVGLGYISLIISYLLLIFTSQYWLILLGIIFSSTGVSLISGSDQAYFQHLIPDYRKFYPLQKNFSLFSTLIGMTLGSYFFKFSPSLPLTANVIVFSISLLILIFLPNDAVKESGFANPFHVAKAGIKIVYKSLELKLLLIIFALMFAFSNSLKWIFGNIMQVSEISLHYWGTILTLVYLARFTGIWLSPRIKLKRFTTSKFLLTSSIILFAIGIFTNAYLLIFLLTICMVIIGIAETEIEVSIQEKAPENVRASILSLKSLTGRFAASIFVLISAKMLSEDSIFPIMAITAALFVLSTLTDIFRHTKRS